MAQGRPISPKKIAAVLADLDQEKPRNQIARDHGISAGTVTNIARKHGKNFDRSKTEKATRAVELDNKSRRALLAKRMLDAADQALMDMRSPYIVHDFGFSGYGKKDEDGEIVGGGWEFVTKALPRPPAGDQRSFMVIAATAIDKSIVIDKHDNVDEGQQAARTMLGKLGELIAAAAQPLPETPDA